MEDLYEIIVPKMGTGDEKVAVIEWFVEEDENVEEGDDLVELGTSKEEVTLTAPVSGTVTNIYYLEGEMVEIDEVIAEIEESEL